MPGHALSADQMIVDEVGEALLLRTPADSAAPLVAMTSALLTAHGESMIVAAPTVTARSDFFRLLAEVIDEHVRGDGAGIRLVAIGNLHDPATVESDVRVLANRTGHTVMAPLGSITVASNGAIAVAAHRRARGGWMTCSPGGSSRFDVAWFPVPAWARPLLADTARVKVRGMATAHPVPAGFWILPRGLSPGSAGVAAVVPPDDRIMAVFLGGCAEPPVTFTDAISSLSELPLSNQSRVVLLPDALMPGGDVVRLRDWCSPSVLVVAAVPMWSDESAWGLVAVGPAGGLAFRPRVIRSAANGSHQPGSTVRMGSYPAQHRTARAQPASVRQRARRQATSGERTAAGWSFLANSPPIGFAPAARGFVVEVDIGESGFLVHGRLVEPDRLADMIDVCCPNGRTSVVIVGHGSQPSGPVANEMYGALADALGRELIAADDSVSLSPTGMLYTSGRFRAWRPTVSEAAGPPARRSRLLGDTVPPMPVPLPADERAYAPARPSSAARATLAARSMSAAPASGARVVVGPPTTEPDRTPRVAPPPVAPSSVAAPSPRPAEHAPRRTSQQHARPTVAQAGYVAPRRRVPSLTSRTEVTVAQAPARPAPPAGPPRASRPRATPAQAASTQGSLPAAAPPHAAPRHAAPTAPTHHAAPLRTVPRVATASVAGPVLPVPTTSGVPVWITAALCDVDDRVRLRQVLTAEYDAHARVVAQTLMDDPRLRDADPSLVTGLIAVRAYCATERDTVNRVLRGVGDSRRVSRAIHIAGCAASGLRGLPAVFGPVFATSGVRIPTSAYVPGIELGEPGFIDVDLVPTDHAGPGVDYLIWSVSARRLGPIGPTDRATALFPVASRFVVLAVDSGPERPRVMLLDLAARHSGPDRTPGAGPTIDDIIERLRHSVRRSRVSSGILGFPIGVDNSGLPYPHPEIAPSSDRRI